VPLPALEGEHGMQIKEMRVDWMEGWANAPQLHATVDKLPEREDLRFKKIEGPGWCLYHSVHESGYVSFNAGTGDHEGYGGAKFVYNMEDGTVETWVGPWSSNSMSMNRYFPASIECVFKEEEGKFPTLGYAGHMLISKVLQFDLPGAIPLFTNDYGNDKELPSFESLQIMAKIIQNPLAIIGPFALTFKQVGFATYKDSQQAKAALHQRRRY